MKTIKKIQIELIYVEFIPNIENMEFGKFYFSEKYKISNHLCVCGCGNQVPLPIKSNEWSLSKNNNTFSISPSILQRFECKTHYIIQNSIANIV